MSSLKERVDREREAHSERDVLAENRRIRGKFPHTDQYASKLRLYASVWDHLRNLEGKLVLDYGCGIGDHTAMLLRAGAKTVYGMDISEKYIEQAKLLCAAEGYPPDRYDLRVMDAHKLEYQDEIFDVVVGFGILHHLETEVAFRELYRVLKLGGRLLFVEPLADNPLLKIFRLLTPHARTVDEQPFTGRKIKQLLQGGKWTSEISYAGLIEAPIAVVTSLVMPSKVNNMPLRVADKIEVWANNRGILSSWNQIVLLNLIKNK